MQCEFYDWHAPEAQQVCKFEATHILVDENSVYGGPVVTYTDLHVCFVHITDAVYDAVCNRTWEKYPTVTIKKIA